jgi:hypothetical protein
MMDLLSIHFSPLKNFVSGHSQTLSVSLQMAPSIKHSLSSSPLHVFPFPTSEIGKAKVFVNLISHKTKGIDIIGL